MPALGPSSREFTSDRQFNFVNDRQFKVFAPSMYGFMST